MGKASSVRSGRVPESKMSTHRIRQYHGCEQAREAARRTFRTPKQAAGSKANPFNSPQGVPEMRCSGLVVLGSLMVFAPLAVAQRKFETEAQQDGFAGRVKLVTTMVERSGVEWQQP